MESPAYERREPALADGVAGSHKAISHSTADDCGRVLTMQVVHVHVRVKPESIEAFRDATVENARNSVREAGIARFDVIQNALNPVQFVLVEVYRNSEAPAQHKATAHYEKWRDAVAEMMAEPRTSSQFRSVFPDDEGW